MKLNAKAERKKQECGEHTPGGEAVLHGGNLPSSRKYCRTLALFLMVCTLMAGVSRAAADVSAEFSAANKLYAEGKFKEAAGAWEQTIQETRTTGSASAALYFNYGNAEFKLGRLGRAIAAYRHAALLTPRDSDVLGNLEFARDQVQGATVRPGRWQSWVGALTLNEGTGLTAGAFWLMFLLLAVKQLRPALAPRLHGVTLAAVGATVLFGAVLAVQATGHFSRRTAVVIESNVIARSGPFDEAQNAFAVHDGAELTVLDRHDDWYQVADGAGKTGWLPRRQVELLPGA
jgi:tetratricopeptide (TPR) repeat protein